MNKMLIVPIHIDALYLSQPSYVTGAMADFTRLPYFDAAVGRDVNPDTPYLSEAILSIPFQDQGSRLKAGIHLHWSLPDALTRAQQPDKDSDQSMAFPTVPNRWLVTRSRQQADQAYLAEKQWIVESDYLSDDNPNSVDYPYIPGQMPNRDASNHPFSYLGRKIPVPGWPPTVAEGSYLAKLTAVGYGEPTFAAFYPNCHSVFGLHDPECREPDEQLRYDVIGWYSNVAQDELCSQLKKKAKDMDLRSFLEEALGWTVPEDEGSSQLERMFCFAQITFSPGSVTDFTNPKLAAATGAETGVSIGNTATEALAAHLGSLLKSENNQSDPDDLENLLEALRFADHLEQQRLDVGAKLKEARHEATFRPLSRGKLWAIRRQDENPEQADAELARKRENLEPTPELAHALDRLNRLQSDYDRAQQELADRRGQTYADWYKYMVCAYPPETNRESYPDIDEVKHFITTKDILPLHKLEADITASSAPYGAKTLADRLASVRSEVEQLLDKTNKELDSSQLHSKLILKAITPPRYYLPNEPVVLLTGAAATPSNRHGYDGRLHPEGHLECRVADPKTEGDTFPSQKTINSIRNSIIPLFADQTESDCIGINLWKHQPWHPILLQWEVEFFPTREGNNLDASNRSYQPNFIEKNYELAENEVELRIKPGKIPPDKAVSVYAGTTILSSAAQSLVSGRISDYLHKHQPADSPGTQYSGIDKQKESTGCGADIQEKHEQKPNQKFQTLRDIYQRLQPANRMALLKANGGDNPMESLEGSNLAQSLGGFNDALLSHKTTLQTPIADPIGFEAYQAFAAEVRAAVAGNSIRAPQPFDDFNPIRAGAMKLLRLRLIDNFGVSHDVSVDKMTTTQQLRLEGYPDWVALLPRLAQPARINFRWLAAKQGGQETNSHQDTSPVCGWLMPNNLDASLAVYDQAGRAIGSLYALPDANNTQWAKWRPAPGRDEKVQMADIENSHLKKIVEQVRNKGPEFVRDFLAAIDSALEGIDPESAAQHRSLALLMGRPIAVVRASVNLELLGLPAINQSWNSFRQDMRRGRRDSDGFTQVRFPIRIGEHRQLNDGLVGYWLENSAFEISGPFYAAQSEPSGNRDIVTYHEEPIVIQQSIAAAPQHLSMLVDPRGVVHATSGILPTKAIDIPTEHYSEALRNIEVTFFSAPILSDADQLDLPLPREPGYIWSWLQRDKKGWTETSTLQTTIRQSVFVSALGQGGEALWQTLKQSGWLVPLEPKAAAPQAAHDETALVVAADQRPTLPPDLVGQQEQIEKALDQPTIDPARVQENFMSQATLNEGWLKLRAGITTSESKTKN